ncbi:FecCD family ABC transporter permease [Microbacterium paraoxydans]|uniref:FecCD family ABC transporter permease n=1 Tax=Microbacterium paraoxydans TaxID=199592 RepID=UPI001CF98ED5|nr:iron chelate uptake ABC transporter family permease subunit [Microbacterium paraoxydans]
MFSVSASVDRRRAPAAASRVTAWTGVALVSGILIVSLGLSLAIGARFVPLDQVVASLFGAGDQNVLNIVGELRVTRTVNAVICGIALGAAGVLMQALTRNPIADPGMLGVSAGASFGVVAGMSVFGALGVGGAVWLALAGAALASAVIFWFSGTRFASGSPVRLILAGVAFSAILAGASQAIVLTDETVLDAFRFWRVGSLTARPVEEALGLVVFIVAGVILALLLGPALNLLALGDDSAMALGVKPGVVRALVLVAVTLLCGTATAIAGPIAFVGLVIPHLLRRFVGPDLRILLPLSLLAAPAMLLLADTLGRVIGGGGEVQVGIVTALVGGPLLIAFVVGRRTAGIS